MKKLKTLSVWGLMFVCSLFVLGLLGVATQSPEAAIGSLWMGFMPFAGMIYGTKIFDWKKIEKYKTLEDKKGAIVATLAHFINKINSTPVVGQKIVGPDPNLVTANPVVLVMSDTIKSPDRGYEVLFDEVDMRQSQNSVFEVLDVSGGVTFYQQSDGEEAKLSKIPTTAKTQVGFLRFTGGYNLLDDWLRFNQFYKIDQLSADTVRRWYDNKATIFYALLAALSSGINETFSVDDVTTINNACAKILEDLAAAGYPVDENSLFAISCNPKLRGRIFKALAASYLLPNTNNSKINFNISTVVSTTKLANTSYYVSLPGGKSQRGEWEDLNLRPPQRNELILGAAHVWTGAYNGIIGESKQHRRCALS